MSPMLGSLLVAGSALLFSAKAVVVKLAYPHGVDPDTLLCLRLLMAAPCFAVVVWWASRGQEALGAKRLAAIAGLGLLGYHAASILDFHGLHLIGASLERTVLYIYPLLTLAFDGLLERRAPSRRMILAAFAALLGIALTCHGGEGAVSWLGVGLVAASALCFALYITGSARLMRSIGSNRFTGLALCAACGGMFLQFMLTHPLSGLAQPAPVLGWAAVLAVLCTVLPALAFGAGLKAVGPARTAVLSTIGPVGTVLLAWACLGERPTALNAVGMAITIVAGAVVAATPKTPVKTASDQR